MPAQVRALLRRLSDGAYQVHGLDRSAPPAWYPSLLMALNADRAYRQLWRPLLEGESAALGLGPDVLYVVPQ